MFDRLTEFFNRGNSAVRKLIILNAAVFLLTAIVAGMIRPLQDFIQDWFWFEPQFSRFILKPWSVLTYAFIHAGLFHILGNMLWLYFIGILLEDLLGNKHIFRLFLLGGIFGGLFYMAVFAINPTFVSGLPMVGASAGVTAVIIATAVYMPNYEIWFFGLFPLRLWILALVRVVLDLSGLGDGHNDGGQLAHLGGALFGLLYVWYIRNNIRVPAWLSTNGIFRKKQKPVRRYKVEINPSPSRRKKENFHGKPAQEEIDQILDKINQYGYSSLTAAEKETLFRAGDS